MDSAIATETMRSIEEMLRGVTEASVAKYAAALGPVKKGEAAIGRLHNEETRRLFVLAKRIDKLEDQALAEKELAETAEVEQKCDEQAQRYNIYLKLVATLRWCQVHEDIGGYWGVDIGIREGWVVVRIATSAGDPMTQLKEKLREMFQQSGIPPQGAIGIEAIEIDLDGDPANE